MIAKTPSCNPLAIVTDEALGVIRYGKDQAHWLAALMKSIQLDLEHNKGKGVKELARLGQYLSDDCMNYLDSSAEDLQSQFDAIANQEA